MQQVTGQHNNLDFGIKRSKTDDKEVKPGSDFDTGALVIAVGAAIKRKHLHKGLLRG
jgi:hypothetical protein